MTSAAPVTMLSPLCAPRLCTNVVRNCSAFPSDGCKQNELCSHHADLQRRRRLRQQRRHRALAARRRGRLLQLPPWHAREHARRRYLGPQRMGRVHCRLQPVCAGHAQPDVHVSRRLQRTRQARYRALVHGLAVRRRRVREQAMRQGQQVHSVRPQRARRSLALQGGAVGLQSAPEARHMLLACTTAHRHPRSGIR
jgi:hypothetical protein